MTRTGIRSTALAVLVALLAVACTNSVDVVETSTSAATTTETADTAEPEADDEADAATDLATDTGNDTSSAAVSPVADDVDTTAFSDIERVVTELSASYEDATEFINCHSPAIERTLNDLSTRAGAVEGAGFTTSTGADAGCLVDFGDVDGDITGISVHIGAAEIDAYVNAVYVDGLTRDVPTIADPIERGDHRGGTLWHVCASFETSESCEATWIHPDGVAVTYWADTADGSNDLLDDLEAVVVASLDDILEDFSR